MPKIPLFLSALMLLSFSAEAIEPAAERCFARALPAHLLAIVQSEAPLVDVQESVNNVCIDLKDSETHEVEPTYLKVIDAIFVGFVVPLTEQFPTRIRELFPDNSTVAHYRDQLKKIATIENRYERLRLTYELALKSQGRYDYENEIGAFQTPSRILTRAHDHKSGGQCREFAFLLRWSLMQVSRSPRLSPTLAAMGMLDENSFNVREIVNVGVGHVWVEVLLPMGVGEQQRFAKIHLDPTNNKTYSPLFERRTGISGPKRAKLIQQCMAVSRCLKDVKQATHL